MAKKKYTLSKLLWWIQKAASLGLRVYFEVSGHRYDPETGWDFGSIDPKNFYIQDGDLIVNGYGVRIDIDDIYELSLCRIERENGNDKIFLI